MVKAITCDVQHLHRPERQTAALFGPLVASLLGARSCRAFGSLLSAEVRVCRLGSRGANPIVAEVAKGPVVVHGASSNARRGSTKTDSPALVKHQELTDSLATKHHVRQRSQREAVATVQWYGLCG
jgi:hypothetical protein